MLSYFSHNYFMLIAFITRTLNVQACDAGWFGEDCRYMCHCNKTTSCDKNSGKCPDNVPCAIDYFGPACQIVDLTNLETDNSVPSYLHDSRDDTCNPDPAATSVEMVQKNAYAFSFIRIVVKDDILGALQDFTMTLNNDVTCSNERRYRISDTMVDVTCDVSVVLEKLRIEGTVAGSICSIYIGAGRNVALLQNTSQSSTDDNAVSNKAVDGNTHRYFPRGSCTHTDSHIPDPEWNVTFNRPQIIYHMRIYNRDGNEARLIGFKIDTFDERGKLAVSYDDKSTSAQNIYQIHLYSPTPVTSLRISLNGSGRILTLCEVEIYGDPVCPAQTYGIYCQYPCQCDKTERCHITGACASGCKTGFYGFNCSTRCSANCLKGICEWRTGNCYHCSPGYLGKKCDTECDPGFYGKDCKRNCSKLCTDTCNHINGECTCEKEFVGPDCTLCVDTFYGAQCDKRCSLRCLHRLCERKTGKCFSCVAGYQGDYCSYESIYFMLVIIPLVLLVICLCFLARKETLLVAREDQYIVY